MTTYTVYFRSDSETATHDFDADTPEQALALARNLYDADPADLWFEPYDSGMPVNEIAVCDADGEERAVWLDDELRLRLAAHDLLSALESLVEHCRAEAAEAGLADDEMTWLAESRAAIAKAKGGVP